MKNKVVVITGPTGVGKTKISIEVAKKLNTDIINGDAYQIYKEMNIGTAKPTKNELSQVTHHFFDFLDPINDFSVSDYQKQIRSFIDQFSKFRNVLRFKCVAAGAKQIQSLSVHKEDGFLTFMNDKLGQAVKILTRMLPYKRAVVAFVFDYICNCHGVTS